MTTMTTTNKKAVKSILISQPVPSNADSPYLKLGEKLGVKVDFRSFIHVEGVSGKEIRKNRINPLDFTAIIFTSRNAIDHYFRVCKELKITMPAEMKYFCLSEAIALYLQKYIQYRKRKIFFGRRTLEELTEVMAKHKAKENFLFPCSDIHKDTVPRYLEANGFNYTKVILYKTVSSDLSDLEEIFYDIIVFFSPAGLKSLYDNFPKFEQKETRIACFGQTTASAMDKVGLVMDIKAPAPGIPSMAMAIEKYVKEAND